MATTHFVTDNPQWPTTSIPYGCDSATNEHLAVEIERDVDIRGWELTCQCGATMFLRDTVSHFRQA